MCTEVNANMLTSGFITTTIYMRYVTGKIREIDDTIMMQGLELELSSRV